MLISEHNKHQKANFWLIKCKVTEDKKRMSRIRVSADCKIKILKRFSVNLDLIKLNK